MSQNKRSLNEYSRSQSSDEPSDNDGGAAPPATQPAATPAVASPAEPKRRKVNSGPAALDQQSPVNVGPSSHGQELKQVPHGHFSSASSSQGPELQQVPLASNFNELSSLHEHSSSSSSHGPDLQQFPHAQSSYGQSFRGPGLQQVPHGQHSPAPIQAVQSQHWQSQPVQTQMSLDPKAQRRPSTFPAPEPKRVKLSPQTTTAPAQPAFFPPGAGNTQQQNVRDGSNFPSTQDAGVSHLGPIVAQDGKTYFPMAVMARNNGRTSQGMPQQFQLQQPDHTQVNAYNGQPAATEASAVQEAVQNADPDPEDGLDASLDDILNVDCSANYLLPSTQETDGLNSGMVQQEQVDGTGEFDGHTQDAQAPEEDELADGDAGSPEAEMPSNAEQEQALDEFQDFQFSSADLSAGFSAPAEGMMPNTQPAFRNVLPSGNMVSYGGAMPATSGNQTSLSNGTSSAAPAGYQAGHGFGANNMQNINWARLDVGDSGGYQPADPMQNVRTGSGWDLVGTSWMTDRQRRELGIPTIGLDLPLGQGGHPGQGFQTGMGAPYGQHSTFNDPRLLNRPQYPNASQDFSGQQYTSSFGAPGRYIGHSATGRFPGQTFPGGQNAQSGDCVYIKQEPGNAANAALSQFGNANNSEEDEDAEFVPHHVIDVDNGPHHGDPNFNWSNHMRQWTPEECARGWPQYYFIQVGVEAPFFSQTENPHRGTNRPHHDACHTGLNLLWQSGVFGKHPFVIQTKNLAGMTGYTHSAITHAREDALREHFGEDVDGGKAFILSNKNIGIQTSAYKRLDMPAGYTPWNCLFKKGKGKPILTKAQAFTFRRELQEGLDKHNFGTAIKVVDSEGHELSEDDDGKVSAPLPRSKTWVRDPTKPKRAKKGEGVKTEEGGKITVVAAPARQSPATAAAERILSGMDLTIPPNVVGQIVSILNTVHGSDGAVTGWDGIASLLERASRHVRENMVLQGTEAPLQQEPQEDAVGEEDVGEEEEDGDPASEAVDDSATEPAGLLCDDDDD